MIAQIALVAILVAKIAMVAILVAKIAMVARLLWWQRRSPCIAKLLYCRKTSGLVGNLTWLSMFISLLCFDKNNLKLNKHKNI